MPQLSKLTSCLTTELAELERLQARRTKFLAHIWWPGQMWLINRRINKAIWRCSILASAGMMSQNN